MKLKADLFPYPVLYKETDDYINSEFYTKIKITTKSSSLVDLTVHFHINNPEIESKLSEGSFSFAVHLEGVSSSYRQLIEVPIGEKSTTIELSSEFISSKVEVNTMIIANKEIFNYSNSLFNPIYYENHIVRNIKKGDIIAYDTMADLRIEFENRENPNAKSMIRVSAKNENYMSIDIEGDFIQVYLPEKSHQAYIDLSKSNEVKRNLLLATIVQPTLMYVIERIKSEDIVDENLQWYIALINLLEGLGYTEYSLKNIDSIKLAQELLDMPLENSLYDFYEWEENK